MGKHDSLPAALAIASAAALVLVLAACSIIHIITFLILAGTLAQ